jgi:energy-coupling factor transporter ATP-binding protein EcfA2
MKKCIISHLTFTFENQTHPFFHNINLTFEPGTLYFVKGKNGVGKSTFFSILQGTTPQDTELTGSVEYDSQHYTIKSNTIPKQISDFVKTVVQDSNTMIASSMSVEENLQLAQLSPYPLPVPLPRLKDVPVIMKEFNLNSKMPVYHLSGGQKQILAIIMALQKPTHILLLDEPTAALDEKNSTLVMNFLSTLAHEQQLIIIVITHDSDIIAHYGKHNTITITQDHNNIRTIKQE